ncbi:MAG: hypothetical protein LBV38_01595 [Alistipes sp.]|jgi:hypothetical protein|nr:hypothetical protein [Alistipes sp.]
MDDVDTLELNEYDDETMFLNDVVGDEHELLMLDSYLREAFRGRGAFAAAGTGGGVFAEEATI